MPAVPYEAVLEFWFVEADPESWWSHDPAFDGLIRRRFAELHEQASHGELYEWRAATSGRLAEILVLDQFSRNLFRGSGRAYAQDLAALALAQEAVAAGAHRELEPERRAFLLLPYMHSVATRTATPSSGAPRRRWKSNSSGSRARRSEPGGYFLT